MHSLKTSYGGQIYALAKPHHEDSVVGKKRTRNRIPKDERKTLVQSFIHKHQRLNNGRFPSLSLTHKEVGGSFYTIREIVREIIQENRVLGTTDLILQDDDHLQDQALSRTTVLMDPVPPLSLSPHGLSHHNLSSGPVEATTTTSLVNDGEYINGSKVGLEVNGYQISESVGSTDIPKTQFAASSCSEEIDTKYDDNGGDSFVVKAQDKEEAELDNKEAEIDFIEPEAKNPLNNNQSVKDDDDAAIDLLSVVETFSVTSSELARVREDGKETEAKVEDVSSTETCVEIPEEEEKEVIVGQIPNHISLTTEKKAEENSVIGCVHDTKEFRNGSLTTEQQPVPTSGPQSGSCKNEIGIRSEVTSVVEKATVEKGRVDDASTSQKGNIATLNRIKPESWKEQSNAAGQETNPLLAVLKSFLTAFVKFWSE